MQTSSIRLRHGTCGIRAQASLTTSDNFNKLPDMLDLHKSDWYWDDLPHLKPGCGSGLDNVESRFLLSALLLP